MKIILACLITLCSISVSCGQDWKGVAVPADAGEGKVWKLNESLSDDFNYEAPAEEKGSKFGEKWTDSYHNAWTGPGKTIWDPKYSHVADGQLQITAGRANTDQVYTGCITSKKRVKYPVYVEARAKISNSTLASDVWMLSPDDTQEIDVIEAYGTSHSAGAEKKEQKWFAERIHLSHHVFIRKPFQDYQPTDQGSWYTDKGKLWRKNFVRVGVHWKDPFNLDYYVNGKLARTASGKEMIDPKGFTDGTGLSKEMDIIINVEDQPWRSAQGLTPTDEELAKKEDHTFKVDWIRVYKPAKE